MIGIDYLQFKRACRLQRESIIQHSAKGSTWKEHKYIRKENGKYIYENKETTKKNKLPEGEYEAEDGDTYTTKYLGSDRGALFDPEEKAYVVRNISNGELYYDKFDGSSPYKSERLNEEDLKDSKHGTYKVRTEEEREEDEDQKRQIEEQLDAILDSLEKNIEEHDPDANVTRTGKYSLKIRFK